MTKRKPTTDPVLTCETVPTGEDKSGRPLERGDVIRVKGEVGKRFRFWGTTTHKGTGNVWLDAHEIHGQDTGALRAFRRDRVEAVKKRKKAKK